MSISPAVQEQHPAAVEAPLSMAELAILLVKHYGLNEGTYDLLVQYQLGTGAVGPDKDRLVPGVMVGVSHIGLIPSTNVGPSTVDASLVNPAKKYRKKPAA